MNQHRDLGRALLPLDPYQEGRADLQLKAREALLEAYLALREIHRGGHQEIIDNLIEEVNDLDPPTTPWEE